MKSREELKNIMEKISLKESPVGIDAKYTHAVIIDKLTRIEERLRKLEEQVKD